MAASSEEDESTSDGHVCSMCIFPPKSAKVKQFCDKTWCRFLDYVPQWEKLKGNQAKIATDFIARHGTLDIVRPNNTAIAIPQGLGFHTICYQRFTDKQRIARAKRSLEKEINMTAASTSATNIGKFDFSLLTFFILIINR